MKEKRTISRTRRVGGKLNIRVGGDYTINALDGDISFTAVGEIVEACQATINYRNYNEQKQNIASMYFVRGWWTDEDDNPISEALLGDTVKFHLETKNIPDGEVVFMTLYDDDRRVQPLDEDSENDKISLINTSTGKTVLFKKVKNNKIIRQISLNNLEAVMQDEKDGVLELFFACTYQHPKLERIKETKDLPYKPKEYLKVKGMPKIILVNGHWKTAHRAPFGEQFGPTEPLKPYWVNGMAEYANGYYDKYSNKKKYTLNKKELRIEELEKRNYILYYDGSSDHLFDQSGQDRFNNGKQFAQDNYQEIIQGLGNESIYLVSHSEGGAYAAGMADYLYEQGHTIGEHVLLSPDEGNEFEINPAIPSYQILYMFFSSIYNPIGFPTKAIKFRRWGDYYAIVDWAVNEYKIKGITKMGIVHRQDSGWQGVHGWTNGSRVFQELSDLKKAHAFDVIGEHEGEFYSGYSQANTKNKTKFYRINDDYIITNCPPLIKIP